ncbi:uncharacterized protein PV09_08124 [Verruconis gallopava]|uniref:AB hydrolase-1 domain-containing protein n=1 Tax=Verruconis gallopava TaxID=253628 RepID=A0A0D1YHT0_9PEZI|nr:uncharacterized protein PV09_08124 [Verruconis gallopava]KIW00417.1 hypothetical protein PV09_08124 [Verruconis gallopava]
MATPTLLPSDIASSRPVLQDDAVTIPAPTHAEFIAHFGDAFPAPVYLQSEYGQTAVYVLSPVDKSYRSHSRCPILLVHGLNTPALGMLPLAHRIQSFDPTAEIVLFDLWGHGLSSTPLSPHTPFLFHFQILQVLSYMNWTSAHIVGYSFGGSTVASFASVAPWALLSVTLLAPVGLLSKESFNTELQDLLEQPAGRENQLMEAVLSWLEGGPLVVPDDWWHRTRQGEVVPEAFRGWELRQHRGYTYSVLSMFQYGGLTGREETFRKLANLPVKKMVILAELDQVCSKELLDSVGILDVVVLAHADHGFVRSKAEEIASILNKFWLAKHTLGENLQC